MNWIKGCSQVPYNATPVFILHQINISKGNVALITARNHAKKIAAVMGKCMLFAQFVDVIY